MDYVFNFSIIMSAVICFVSTICVFMTFWIDEFRSGCGRFLSFVFCLLIALMSGYNVYLLFINRALFRMK